MNTVDHSSGEALENGLLDSAVVDAYASRAARKSLGSAEVSLTTIPETQAVKAPNRFAPPRAPLDVNGGPSTQAVRKAFPWLFVLRYVVGAFVLISALIGVYALSQSWARLADRSIIDPIFSPYRYLPVILLKTATGVAILSKRKLSLALTLLWTIAFLYLLWGNGPLSNLGSDVFLNMAILIGLFAFQCLLLARGLLR